MFFPFFAHFAHNEHRREDALIRGAAAFVFVVVMVVMVVMVMAGEAFAASTPSQNTVQQAQPTAPQTRQMAPQARPAPVDQGLMDLYKPFAADSNEKTSVPHRTSEELAAWLSGVMIDTLEIKANNAKETIERVRQYFTQPAYREYLSFLSERSYWLFINQRKYDMTAASVQLPSLLCKQNEDGFYTWIFEVPVIVTLNESEATPDPSGKTAREVVNLRVRLVRIPNMKQTLLNPNEVLIENWRLQDETKVLNDDESGCMVE